jgi:hypothetical protein
MSTTTPLPLAGKSAIVAGAVRSIGANQTVDAIREMGG